MRVFDICPIAVVFPYVYCPLPRIRLVTLSNQGDIIMQTTRTKKSANGTPRFTRYKVDV